MSDKANPLALYHQRQIENQATPVHLIGSDPLNIQTDSVIIEQGGATEVTLEAVEARLEAVESLLSGTLTTQLSGSNGAVSEANPLPTVAVGREGLELLTDTWAGSLAAKASQSIIDTQDAVSLEWLELVFPVASVDLHLRVQFGSSPSSGRVHSWRTGNAATGTFWSRIPLSDLHEEEGTAYLDVLCWEPGKHKLTLKRPTLFPYGLHITLFNNHDSSNFQVGVTCGARVITRRGP